MMMTKDIVETGHMVLDQNNIAKKVRHLTLAVLVAVSLVGIVIVPFEIRFGVFTAAIILGWTQLVGL